MYVCMCMYVFMCVCVCVYMYKYVFVFLCTGVYLLFDMCVSCVHFFVVAVIANVSGDIFSRGF